MVDIPWQMAGILIGSAVCLNSRIGRGEIDQTLNTPMDIVKTYAV